jgi:hypothetical protein
VKFVNNFHSLGQYQQTLKTAMGYRLRQPLTQALMGRRRLAGEALAARRGAGKSSRKPLKTNHRV